MVTAIEYRAMALQHHRWAGMCRSPQSREDHFRLEKELLALAESEERMRGMRAPEQASNPQRSKGKRCEARPDGGLRTVGFRTKRGNRMLVLRLHRQKATPEGGL